MMARAMDDQVTPFMATLQIYRLLPLAV
jgi:hypothetical protein